MCRTCQRVEAASKLNWKQDDSMAVWNYIERHWQELLTPVAVFLAVLGAGWFARRMVFRFLRKWASRSKSSADDFLIQAVHGPFLLWMMMLGLHVATQVSRLPARVTALVAQALLVLWIISITVLAARLAVILIRHYGRGVSTALPVTSLTESLATGIVAVLGLLLLLNTLGISVTPILTALGVGGLAVALALQDTLSNLFAGFYVSLAGQVRPGDYVRLDSGDEGYVSDIGWRSTTLRSLPNNLIVVPNAKLAQAIVTNYNLPEKPMGVSLQVSVSLDSDPDHVERVLLEEVGGGFGQIPGLRSESEPSVRFGGFGKSSLDFSLNCQVNEFVDQYVVQHELRKRILRRFRKEGIDIAIPAQTVVFKGREPDRAEVE